MFQLAHLKLRKDDTIKKTVGRMLRVCLTDEVGKAYSFTGRKAGKDPFNTLAVCKVVFGKFVQILSFWAVSDE